MLNNLLTEPQCNKLEITDQKNVAATLKFDITNHYFLFIKKFNKQLYFL